MIHPAVIKSWSIFPRARSSGVMGMGTSDYKDELRTVERETPSLRQTSFLRPNGQRTGNDRNISCEISAIRRTPVAASEVPKRLYDPAGVHFGRIVTKQSLRREQRRAKSANFLEGGQDYFLAIFVTFGPLRGPRNLSGYLDLSHD